MKKREKRVTTPDNWHPTADDGTVHVSLHHDRGSQGWRVAVWGDDDFGLELCHMDTTDAFDTFRSIHDGVTQETLRKRGFIAA